LESFLLRSFFCLRWGPTPSAYHASLSLGALFRTSGF
jgi:hypothetical protein